MKHKVICGIPTKNEELIINKTLKSLVQYCDTVLIYDDGSTDKTEEICRSYDNVVWETRPPHDPYRREEALQRFELLNLLGKYDPEYVLLLDADEIPTPNIVDFINNIDTDVDLWRTRMINLWEDETKYRVDKFTTKYGTSVNWDPFDKNSWTKHVLMKYNKDIKYEYNLEIPHGGCSRYHPSPRNPGENVKEQEDFYTIHYGKLSPSYLNNDLNVLYSKFESLDPRKVSQPGRRTFDERLEWHTEHGRTDFLETKETEKDWFWENS